MLQKCFLNHSSLLFYLCSASKPSLDPYCLQIKYKPLNVFWPPLFPRPPPRPPDTRNIHYYHHLTSSSSPIQGNLTGPARPFSNVEIFPDPPLTGLLSLFPQWMPFISLQALFICHILHPIVAISVIALSAQWEQECLENRCWFLVSPTKEDTMPNIC